MSEQFPKGYLVSVKMTVALPEPATWKEIMAWLEFRFGINGSLAISNPLSEHEPEPFAHDYVIEGTGFVGNSEEFDHVATENGATYKVRNTKTRYVPGPVSAQP